MRRLTFFENSGFINENGRLSTSLTEANLDYATAVRLSDFRIEEGQSSFAPFKVAPRSISASNIVGVFCIEGLQIEILPKLYREQKDISLQRSESLQNLVRILQVTSPNNIWVCGSHDQSVVSDTLLEIVIAAFCEHLSKYLLQGLKSEYASRQEKTESIKGRIRFSSNSLAPPNCFIQPFCEWDEFSVDTRLNRSLRWLAGFLSHQAISNSLRESLCSLERRMATVGESTLFPEAFSESHELNRNRTLSTLISIARTILLRRSPSIYGAGKENLSIAFNMANLFEGYVAAQFWRHRKSLSIEKLTVQKGKRLLSGYKDFDGEFTNVLLRNTFSDIVLELSSGRRIIVDTKYKILDEAEQTLGINNADIFQITNYQALHSLNESIPEALLIFPQHSKKIRRAFRLNLSANRWFGVSTFDLSVDPIGESEMIRAELSQAISSAA